MTKVRVRNGCDKAKFSNDSVESGVPYENATPIEALCAIAVASIQFHVEFGRLLEELAQRPQLKGGESLRKSKKGTGTKAVRKSRVSR